MICPTPKKARYPDADTALIIADLRYKDWKYQAYECDCGWWHLTTRRKEWVT